jgi:hypothetical protein
VAFFIQLSLSIFGYAVKTDWILLSKFYFLVSLYYLNFLIENNRYCLNIEFVEQFNLQKSYIEPTSVCLYPVNVILFYYDSILKIFLLYLYLLFCLLVL